MSSDYHAICLNHDPAMVVYDLEWSNPGDAEDAIKNREAHDWLTLHLACDLVIGRWSGGIVELGCPPGSHQGAYHARVEWIEVSWLRLLLDAYGTTGMAQAIFGARLPSCWTEQRLVRLGNLLSPKE